MNFKEAFMSFNFFLLVAIAIDGFYAELDLWMRCRFLATLKKQFWHCGHAHLFFWYSFLQTGTSRLRIDLTSVICIGPWSFIKGQKLMLYRWNLPLSFLWHFWQFYAQYLTMVMLGTLKRSQSKHPFKAIATARKVTRIMIAVVVSSLICWVPFNILAILLYLGLVRYKAVFISSFGHISCILALWDTKRFISSLVTSLKAALIFAFISPSVQWIEKFVLK